MQSLKFSEHPLPPWLCYPNQAPTFSCLPITQTHKHDYIYLAHAANRSPQPRWVPSRLHMCLKLYIHWSVYLHEAQHSGSQTLISHAKKFIQEQSCIQLQAHFLVWISLRCWEISTLCPLSCFQRSTKFSKLDPLSKFKPVTFPAKHLQVSATALQPECSPLLLIYSSFVVADFRGSVGEVKTLLGLQHTVINPSGCSVMLSRYFTSGLFTRMGTWREH